MYAIRYLCPRDDLTIGGHGFCIDLHPQWKEYVAQSEITEKMVSTGLQNRVKGWLKGVGFSDERIKLYSPPHHGVRFRWGEWGLEHIDVPGNACGLDIDPDPLDCLFEGGVSLHPHNIDTWQQKNLLLIFFTATADDILLFARTNLLGLNKPRKDRSGPVSQVSPDKVL